MAEHSYNGWPASPDPGAIGVVKFGDPYGYPFPGGVKGGDVHTVLGYVAQQLHERVEQCVAGWCWGYNYRANVNNPSTLSCHASGTAIDWLAPRHPNGASGTFTSAQVAQIRQILAECQGAVQWGGDYSGTPDEMHFEIIVDAAYLADVAASLPDNGGSTAPTPPGEEDEMADYIVGCQTYGLAIIVGGQPFTPIGKSETADAFAAAGAKRVTVPDSDWDLLNKRALGVK